MPYKVLARKWRPQKFQDVIGQAHITLTLQNALKKDRVGHAYLFVGPRGIGKTTTARIFAKALNCSTPEIDADGKPEPCCECVICQEITAGNCLDVIEIDGASHNKVEDMRGLRDTVPYAPTNGRAYKIYIIDEVHMLTTGAWNALLKTLEEPPPHVKFLFATTEAHKVLPTIVSRCQRFDLKRISVPLIVQQLQKIAETENILIDATALAVIARAADGGMRDAESIFDQMIAFCGGDTPDSQIKESDVIDVFGLTSAFDLKRLINALVDNHPAEVISIVHHLADNGRNLERLYMDLLSCLRNLVIFQYVVNPESIVELSESEFNDYKELAEKCSPGLAQRLAEGLMAYGGKIRNYLNKRIFLELTLLRIMRDAHSPSVDDLVTQLREIRQGKEQLSQSSFETAVKKKRPLPSAEKSLNSGTTSSSKNTLENDREKKCGDKAKDDSASSITNQQEAPHNKESINPPVSLELENTNVREPASSGLKSANEQTNVQPNNNELLSLVSPGIDNDQTLMDHRSLSENEKRDNILLQHPQSDEYQVVTEKEVENHVKAETVAISKCETTQVHKIRKQPSRKEAWESLEQNEFVISVCKIFNGKIVDVRG